MCIGNVIGYYAAGCPNKESNTCVQVPAFETLILLHLLSFRQSLFSFPPRPFPPVKKMYKEMKTTEIFPQSRE